MLPGLKSIPAFNGGGSAGGGSGGTMTFSVVGYAAVASTNVTVPVAAIAGDFAILFDACANTSGGAIGSVVPVGWTSTVDTFTDTGSWSMRSTVSYTKLTSAGGASISGMVNGTKILMVFRPSSSISTIVPSTWNAEVASGNPALQTVSASGVATPVLVFAWASLSEPGITYPTFSTETPSMTNLTRSGTAGQPDCRLGYTIYNTSPSNQSIDIGDGGGMNGLQSGYVRFT